MDARNRDRNRGNHRLPILHDPLIISRVKQYLEDNVHQTYVDVAVMAQHLQQKYRDYTRHKAAPFRQLVDQAYRTVLHSYGLDSNPTSEDDELEVTEERPQPPANVLNNLLNTMYANKTMSADNEDAINISSDESDGELSEQGRNQNHASIGNNAIRFSKELTVSKRALGDLGEPSGSQDANEVSALQPPRGSPRGGASVPTKKRKYDTNRNDNDHDGPTLNGRSASLSSNKSVKHYKREYLVQRTPITFKNVGGIDKILRDLCELLLHIKHPSVSTHFGLPPPHGLLLCGPPGAGKTLLAQAIAGQLDVGLIQVAGTELIAGISGESEERIRELFEQAVAAAPCVLFIDEIDTISSNRVNAGKDMERRIVAQLLISLDALRDAQVIVIGATNRIDSLDPALRRVGRFDQEITLGIPDRPARAQILRIICSHLRLAAPFNYDEIAALTPGYVGADLLALASRSALYAIKRAYRQKQENALKSSICLPKKSYTAPMVLTEDMLMEIDSVLDDNKELLADAPLTPNTEVKTAEKPAATAIDANSTISSVEVSLPILPEPNESTPTDELIEGSPSANDGQQAADTSSAVNDSGEAKEPAETSPAQPIVLAEKDAEVVEILDSDSNNTLGRALLSNPTIKETLNLDVLYTLLSSPEPFITIKELNDTCVTAEDFKEAIKVIQPSAKREGFITVPDVTWNDVGSLQDIRKALQLAILAPVKYPHRLKTLGLQSPSGVLLCGPPGCGKTLLAKAVANEAGINFISVKGPELLNMYVGESERAVRQCFQRARNSAPCVIFFDEFDALCPKRSDASEGSASARVVNQLLTEMDGVEERKDVFIMAATNRPDMVDAAVLRPGRVDKILYVGMPEKQDRREILAAITKNGSQPPLADDVSIDELAELTDSYTGADLAGLVREASLQALQDSMDKLDKPDSCDDILKVNKEHFTLALQNLRPSVTAEDKIRYEILRRKYVSNRDQSK